MTIHRHARAAPAVCRRTKIILRDVPRLRDFREGRRANAGSGRRAAGVSLQAGEEHHLVFVTAASHIKDKKNVHAESQTKEHDAGSIVKSALANLSPGSGCREDVSYCWHLSREDRAHAQQTVSSQSDATAPSSACARGEEAQVITSPTPLGVLVASSASACRVGRRPCLPCSRTRICARGRPRSRSLARSWTCPDPESNHDMSRPTW